MIKPIRFNPQDYLTQPLIDSHALAIQELQAIVGGNPHDHRDIEQAMVYVKNDTGSDLTKGAVVALGDPIYSDPTGDEAMFLHGELAFTGETPSETGGHEGKFAVLDQAIGNGNVGVACIQGVVRVKVIFTTGTEEWADITDGSTATLTAAATGSARILWREGTGAGTVWCACLIGCNADCKVAATSKDSRPAALRSTAAELAETPTKPHKIVGDNEAHLPAVAAGAGWIACEVLGAADTNQQLVIQHKHTGAAVDTSLLSDCWVNNFRIDAGHITAIQMQTSGGLAWYDAFTGAPL